MTPENLPLVSIAIPVFNGANFMREAIDSALAQTYPNVEVLVVNDGSSDDGETARIAESYGNKIRYFSKQNGGVASALNLALRNSGGTYFCWLSHDDIYLPEKIAKEVALLQSTQESEAVVFCHHAVMDRNGVLIDDQPPMPAMDPQRAAYHLILEQRLHCCTVLAPKTAYLAVGGFREDLPTTQDYDLLVKMGLRYPFYGVADTLVWARSHPDQGSATLMHQDEIEKFFYEHIPLLAPDYIQRTFTSEESIEAFIALAKQMQLRGLNSAVNLVGRQMIRCEAMRGDPGALWNATCQISAIHPLSAIEMTSGTVAKIDDGTSSKCLPVKKFARDWTPPAIWRALSVIKHRLRSAKQGREVLLETAASEVTRRTAHLDFDQIYATNGFIGTESLSGGGSSMDQTRVIRHEIPPLLRELNVRHLLDVPCGDWNWMRHVSLDDVRYTGGDVVQAIVDRNRQSYANESINFERLNIIAGPLPKSDLILCRDCLVHLSLAHGLSAIDQFRKSGSTWLLTTTFIDREENDDLHEGDIWRPLNLEKAPFNLGPPVRLIREGCTEGNGEYGDKSLGLWRIDNQKQ